MKILPALLLCGLLGLSSHRALADAVIVHEVENGKDVWRVLLPGVTPVDDPRILVHRLVRGSVEFTGYSFSFVAPDGTGAFDFFNDNPWPLLALTLTVTPGGPAADIGTLFDCGIGSDFSFALPYSSCSFIKTGNASTATVVTFFGGPGLPAFSHFALELDGFQPGSIIHASATPDPVPEPSTFLLALSGMGALFARRRKPQGLA